MSLKGEINQRKKMYRVTHNNVFIITMKRLSL